MIRTETQSADINVATLATPEAGIDEVANAIAVLLETGDNAPDDAELVSSVVTITVTRHWEHAS